MRFDWLGAIFGVSGMILFNFSWSEFSRSASKSVGSMANLISLHLQIRARWSAGRRPTFTVSSSLAYCSWSPSSLGNLGWAKRRWSL